MQIILWPSSIQFNTILVTDIHCCRNSEKLLEEVSSNIDFAFFSGAKVNEDRHT